MELPTADSIHNQDEHAVHEMNDEMQSYTPDHTTHEEHKGHVRTFHARNADGSFKSYRIG